MEHPGKVGKPRMERLEANKNGGPTVTPFILLFSIKENSFEKLAGHIISDDLFHSFPFPSPFQSSSLLFSYANLLSFSFRCPSFYSHLLFIFFLLRYPFFH